MKLAIVGSRYTFSENIEAELTKIPDTIISEGNVGLENCVRVFARKHGLKLVEFFPNYKIYGGSRAMMQRNIMIVNECDCILAFWDGTSKSTKFTIDYARKMKKPMKIVRV